MKHGSLFSGIGGFDLAAEWMGWENVFHCEWKEFNQRVLKYYWPNATSYTDITKTDFSIHRGSIDILTGGFPCQPYSTAGKRKGTEDDRHLWPEMLRAIREIQPIWIVGENVSGLVNWSDGLVFQQVHTDLENEGYKVQSLLLPACGIDAPHKRERVWIVAYSNGRRRRECNSVCKEGEEARNGIFEKASSDGLIANSANSSSQGQYKQGQREGKFRGCNSVFEFNNFQNFPTQFPICTGNDGLSFKLDGITFPKWRTESIMAGGNAIVPQVALEIFKVIQQMS